MRARGILLTDFGSTYTKVTAVDAESGDLLGTAGAPTTARTDLAEGQRAAMDLLLRETGPLQLDEQYACSSAAGGLRMIASGLVPELTASAARTAALGAGAKVIQTYAYEMTRGDLQEIEELKPDIFLLTGGIDGGNTACMLHNAALLAQCRVDFPVILAGNRSCADDCAELLHGREVHVCENVLPTLGALNVEPVGAVIRAVFLQRIVRGKGLSAAQELLSGILMPTPAAVMAALELLASDPGGLGALVAVDVGGATTDIYSMADGLPALQNAVLKGLPPPFALRTVEGDIGMRYSARGVVEAAGMQAVLDGSGLPREEIEALLNDLERDPGAIARSDAQRALDRTIAALAVGIAMKRHAGTLERFFTPVGEAFQQTGKDLRGVGALILTGGALVHAPDAQAIAKAGLYSERDPMSLRPVSPRVLTDRRYILSAAGLLAQRYPELALNLMKTHIIA